MDADLRFAYMIAEALTQGKTQQELMQLQVFLQTLSSLITAQIACLRNSLSKSGAGE